MAGTINSLGIGSGVLTADVIEKLKANDEALIITPIDNKITLQKQKNEALNLLSSLLTTFKSSVNALDDDALYQKRSVSGSTDSVSVTADVGVSVQSFSISNTLLAQKNVKESGSFSSTAAAIASGAGTMTISIDGTDYDIAYTATTTLNDLKDSINSVAGDKVKATTLRVGAEDYRLVLTTIETGSNQTINIADSAAVGTGLKSELLAYNATTNPDGMQEIQAARDATFEFNGINITRSSNKIEDIITGVTINLLGETTSSANISITQDVTSISNEMATFVQNYNTLMGELNDMTTSDSDAGTVGVFNGDSSINSISREINHLITSVNSDGYSLSQFGIDLSQDGTMSFKPADFISKFNQDVSLSEKFLSGSTTINSSGDFETVNGVFSTMKTLLTHYTGTNGVMTTLTTKGTDELTSLTKNKTRSQTLLDVRYESMTARFIQYDALISKLENQFSSLKQQIEMAVKGKS